MRHAALVLLALALAGCGGGGGGADKPLPSAPARIVLESPVLRDGGSVPKRYTCDGENISPPLRWSGVPRGTRELVLIVEDPDADRFVHWTVLGISPATRAIAEARPPVAATQTRNSFGEPRYGGPCPPTGDSPHHYTFALYALAHKLSGGVAGASPNALRDAIARGAEARGTLTARYGR